MNTMLWILLCLLASVGLVQSISWLMQVRKRPKKLRRGYHVVPLYNNPDRLEAQVRYSISQLRWGGAGCEIILLVDMGLSGECVTLCEKLIEKSHSVFFCRAEQLPQTIAGLDQLQIPMDQVQVDL